MTIHAADKMGNHCMDGGAPLACSVKGLADVVDIEVVDRKDGTYRIEMRSEVAGTFPLSITIENVHVVGSPTSLTMLAGLADMTQTTVEGDGLKAARAGLTARISTLPHSMCCMMLVRICPHAMLM